MDERTHSLFNCKDKLWITCFFRSTTMLLLVFTFILITDVEAGSFVVNVTQSSYQAEENHNITLEWTFSTRTNSSLNSLVIFCELLTVLKPFVLFHLKEGVEVPESQHEQFAGRVHFDKDVLIEGRLRLHMSRLRTNDSGVCMCAVSTGYSWRSRTCDLNVTAARDWPKPETRNTSGGTDPSQTESPPQPLSPPWIVFCCGLGLIAIVCVLSWVYFTLSKKD